RTTFLNAGHCGMTPKKLDKPEQIARAINRRLLPQLAEAYELWQANVAAARAREDHRRRAADLLATLPGMDSPRRNSYATSRQRAILLAWDGSPRVPDARPGSRHEPRARITVDATEHLETVTVELSHLSAEAASAAVRAAIETSSDTLRTEYTDDPGDASQTLFLYLGSQLVAYADTTPYPNVWAEGRWLYEIAVHPSFRGQGYGTRMLHAVRAKWPDEPLSFTPEVFTPHVK